jgi:hypothetical protein
MVIDPYVLVYHCCSREGWGTDDFKPPFLLYLCSLSFLITKNPIIFVYLFKANHSNMTPISGPRKAIVRHAHPRSRIRLLLVIFAFFGLASLFWIQFPENSEVVTDGDAAKDMQLVATSETVARTPPVNYIPEGDAEVEERKSENSPASDKNEENDGEVSSSAGGNPHGEVSSSAGEDDADDVSSSVEEDAADDVSSSAEEDDDDEVNSSVEEDDDDETSEAQESSADAAADEDQYSSAEDDEESYEEDEEEESDSDEDEGDGGVSGDEEGSDDDDDVEDEDGDSEEDYYSREVVDHKVSTRYLRVRQ